jgi:N-acetylglucosaminyldiphosphoundecaprenol N-acetyl-beta-D-mannosaminyltransferase
LPWPGATTRAPTEIRTTTGSSVLCEIDDFDLATFTRTAAQFGLAHYAYVVTPNVDHLIRYCEDPSFRALYRSARYTLLDSRVVALAMRLLKGTQLAVCPGSDLTAVLLTQVVSPLDPVVLIGGSESQAKELATRYGLGNADHHNPPMGLIANEEATEACLRFIEDRSPFRFCFLAVGSPQQEMIAQRLQARGKARGLVLCVGASLNYLTGAERRAPRWMQRFALEWLYRLMQDPRRLARRYLVRGPRVFRYLLWGRLVLRPRAAGDGLVASSSGRST